MTDRPLRTALVGFGLGGQVFHAPFLATVSGFELTTIVTSSAERAAVAARSYPGARVVASADDVWAAAGDHDLAVVCTTNATHVPLASAALRAGLHVVVDKPLAATGADARAVRDLARSLGLVLAVFQNRRWDSEILTTRAVLASGAIGTPLRFESRFERWRPTADVSRWRESAAPEDAGGQLFDLGSHLIDQAVHLFGPPTHVYSELGRRRPGVVVDDDCFVALTHPGGVQSHLWCSLVAGHLGPRVRLLGSAGALVVDRLDRQEDQLRGGMSPADLAYGHDQGAAHVVVGDEWTAVPAEPGRYQAFWEGVRDAIGGVGPCPVDPDDAVRTIALIEAAGRSAHEHATIAVDVAGSPVSP